MIFHIIGYTVFDMFIKILKEVLRGTGKNSGQALEQIADLAIFLNQPMLIFAVITQ